MGYTKNIVFICLLIGLLWKAEVGIEFDFSLTVNQSLEAVATPAHDATGEDDPSAPAPTANASVEAAPPPAADATAGAAPSGVNASGGVFDVTKHGAVGDGKTLANEAEAGIDFDMSLTVNQSLQAVATPANNATGEDDPSAPAPAPTANASVGAAPPPAANATVGAAPSGVNASGGVFDVTKHGAVGDGKTPANEGFLAAWTAACQASTQSTVLVPGGEFLLNPIKFTGPCTVTPRLELRGKLLAPANMGSSTEKAWITFQKLSQLNIDGVGTGVIDGQGQDAWAAKRSCSSACSVLQVSLLLSGITGGDLGRITFTNSKGFHMQVSESNSYNIHDASITAPRFSPNTDGIHISNSVNITVTDSKIATGDDCVSIGAGTSNIAITNVECGPGHGISLGSLGKYPNEREVAGLIVKDCKFTSTDNGVRIKTWPGAPDNKVSNIRFENLIMENASNPIVINQKYCDKQQNCAGAPSRVELTDIHFKNITGTSFTTNAVILTCSEGVPCSEVNLEDIKLQHALDGQNVTAVCVNVKGVTSGVQVPAPCI